MKWVLNGFWIMVVSIIFVRNIYIPLSLVTKFFEISITVSSILFGVIGIWLSSVYNEGFKAILSKNIQDKSAVSKEIKQLLNPLLCSIASIIFCLFFFISLAIVKDFCLTIQIKKILLQISTSIFVILSSYQIKYLFVILIPLLSMDDILRKKKIDLKNRLSGRINKPKN